MGVNIETEIYARRHMQEPRRLTHTHTHTHMRATAYKKKKKKKRRRRTTNYNRTAEGTYLTRDSGGMRAVTSATAANPTPVMANCPPPSDVTADTTTSVLKGNPKPRTAVVAAADRATPSIAGRRPNRSDMAPMTGHENNWDNPVTREYTEYLSPA